MSAHRLSGNLRYLYTRSIFGTNKVVTIAIDMYTVTVARSVNAGTGLSQRNHIHMYKCALTKSENDEMSGWLYISRIEFQQQEYDVGLRSAHTSTTSRRRYV